MAVGRKAEETPPAPRHRSAGRRMARAMQRAQRLGARRRYEEEATRLQTTARGGETARLRSARASFASDYRGEARVAR